MAKKDYPQCNQGIFSCAQQNKMMNSSSNSRHGARKPPLPSRGPSSAPSKIPSLKKISELDKGSAKALNLPVLNLEKVRRNFVEQAELASNGGGAGFSADPPRVHSARYPADKQKNERRSLLSGSLTDRSMRDLFVERKSATSGSVTDRSCRQSLERKSTASGSLTDRSCRESLGSNYGLSLNGYLRNSRESPLRSSKDSPFSTPTMSKAKTDFSSERVHANRLHLDTKKCRGEKVTNYHSSIFLSNCLPPANPSLSASLPSRSCKNDSLSPKHSNLGSRSFLNSRESSDSRRGGDLRSLHVGNGTDRTGILRTDSGSWDSKRLPLQLVNTLEEALAGVNRTGLSSSEAKKAVVHVGSAKDLNMGRTYGKLYGSSQLAKPSLLIDKLKLLDTRLSQEELSSDELPSSRRSCPRGMGDGNGESANCPKDPVNKLQTKSPKVRPLKLSLGNSQITVPLGFGGNPADNVQSSRPFPVVGDEGNSRLAYTERGTPKKVTMALSCPKREKTSASNLPGHSLGIAMTPEMALKQYGNRLTEYELSEISAYTDIYFLGIDCQKLQPSSTAGSCNYGFDDERGDYSIVDHDHIAYRFEILGLLGKGSFGQVVKCHDHKFRVLRAIKLVRNKKRFHQQALIEVRILQHLRDKAEEEAASYNVVTIHESFYFRGHLCISFSLHDISLYELIKRNNFQGISLVVIKSFATQLLTTLKFLRKLHVIHCDLKPENILLQHSSMLKIKVIDFGSSCFDHERIYTYIQSRFYRSPEVILGIPYDTMIDIWSFGCILAELYTGYPLFPGENEVEQLACIMEVLGVPPRLVLEQATRKKMFFDSNNNPRIVPNSWGKKHWPGTKDLATATGCNDSLFVNFLECCLRWDKNQRAPPQELLQHPWILGEPPVTALRTPLRPANQDTSKRRQALPFSFSKLQQRVLSKLQQNVISFLHLVN